MATPQRLSLLLGFALLTACHGERVDPVDSQGSFITGGGLTTEFPAVGKLIVGNSLCTATLVGNKTVLTAAHCVMDAPTTFLLDNGEQHSATKAVRPAEYTGVNGSYDIAVVILATAPSVAPMPLATRAPIRGESITLVGYGATLCQESGTTVTCTEDSGIKREATNTISAVDPVDFTFLGEGSTCKGDSGGPAFALQEGTLVQLGVTSRGALPCGVQAIDTRVDVFVSWVSQAAEGDVLLPDGQPEPEPVPEPEPEPVPEPEPEPVPEPTPEPDATVNPQPEPTTPPDNPPSDPAPDPTAQPQPESDSALAAEPATEPNALDAELVGGCSVGAGPSGGIFLLALVGLLLLRRRRARCDSRKVETVPYFFFK